MNRPILLGIILGAILQWTPVLSQSQTYRAALALYKASDTPNIADEDVTLNSKNYVKFIQDVRDKADIIIFPEYGLTRIDVMNKLPVHLEAYSIAVREVGYQYRNCSHLDDNLGNIACAARANGVHVILNLVEKLNITAYYLTDVAIDSTGTICMKCRKHHLNNGTSFLESQDQNSCLFTANVKNESIDFAIMYETDMLYEIPDSLKKDNIIMTSAIKNNLPFQYGPSLYTGFAINNNVNLLVSGYFGNEQANNSYGGSGIYLKNGTSTVALNSGDNDQVLIKEIPFMSASSSKHNIDVQIQGTSPTWNLMYLKTPSISNYNKSVRQCLDGENFCCKFEADISQDTIEPYRWVVLQNESTILDRQAKVFICALVKPAATSQTLSFKNLLITSTVKNQHTTQAIPVGVNSKFSFPNSEYENGGTEEISLKLSKEDEILSFGVIRVLGERSEASKYTGVIIGVVIGLLAILGIAAGGYWWYKRNGGYMRPGK